MNEREEAERGQFLPGPKFSGRPYALKIDEVRYNCLSFESTNRSMLRENYSKLRSHDFSGRVGKDFHMATYGL